MFTTKTILKELTGCHIANTFVEQLAKDNPEFAAEQQRYIEAMNALRKDLGDTVNEEMDAISRQCASELLFAGMLGLKANLDNFIDPVARNFLNVDFEVYLREETAHTLPEYIQAQQVRNRFFSRLTPSQRRTYEAVVAYTSHLETAGPKLAHYYGYLLGNELFPRVIPGYHKDVAQTIRYTDMLRQYFADSFPSDL